jgi:hypothetical protein
LLVLYSPDDPSVPPGASSSWQFTPQHSHSGQKVPSGDLLPLEGEGGRHHSCLLFITE